MEQLLKDKAQAAAACESSFRAMLESVQWCYHAFSNSDSFRMVIVKFHRDAGVSSTVLSCI